MKYSPLLHLVLFWVCANLWAQDSLKLAPSQGVSDPSPSASQPAPTPGTLEPQQRWVEQIDGSLAVPSYTSNLQSNPGFGGDINIGYRLDRTWAVFIGSGYYQYNLPAPAPGSSALLAYIPLVGMLRMTLGDGLIRPYLFGEAGLALATYTQNNPSGSAILKTSQAETDFYLAPGLGVLYRFSSDMAVFLQTRLDLVYTSPQGLGIPLTSPSIFIPIQAGISFFAL